jgi:hypothetical protein
MKKKHPDFTQMNDLLDGLIDVEEEREEILAHIESCPECAKEYAALKASVNYLKELRHAEVKFIGLSSRVQRKIRMRKVRRYIIKAAPAAAAAVVLAIGINTFIAPSGDMNMAVKDDAMSRETAVTAMEKIAPSMSSADRLADIFKRNRATVTRDTANFIEGEIPVDTFARFRREVGFRKVSYTYVAVNGGSAASPPPSAAAPAAESIPAEKEAVDYQFASRAKSAAGDSGRPPLYMDGNLSDVSSGNIVKRESRAFHEESAAPSEASSPEEKKKAASVESGRPGEMMMAGETKKRRFVKFRVYK